MAIDRAQVRTLGAFYRDYLLGDVMPFWTSRVGDPDYPGHFHHFDAAGHRTGDDKYIWCQGRQTWMFAALCNTIERRDDWLALAQTGRKLLVDHAYAGGGRFHYALHRDGSVMDDSRSWFTDAFALMALCEHAVATGSDADLKLICEIYDAFERHFFEPGFAEHHHFNLDPSLRYHAPAMIGVGLAPILRPVLGASRVAELADACFERVLWRFAKDEHRALFEMLDGEFNVLDTPLGRTLNPGHALESMWFCLEEALARDDARAINRAIEVTRWSYDVGIDREHGGILAFTDPRGQAPPDLDAVNKFGAEWDTKIWWVHAEALYVLALAALVAEDASLWQDFLDQHEYAQQRFADREHGEWYTYLERDGRPRDTSKGTRVKSAFHVPRALMKLVLLLERYGR